MQYYTGVDIGGTFTDVAVTREDGTVQVSKVLSTPDNYAEGIADGIKGLGPQDGEPAGLIHGTTVGINTITTRTGAATALLTTRGFRDVLAFRRINRQETYDLYWNAPEPLIDKDFIFEVTERVDFTGKELVAVDRDNVREIANRLAELNVEAVAIAFLHSFMNPRHEQEVADLLRERLPDCYISISSDVNPEIMEFERTSTTAVNAYLGPVMKHYISAINETVASINEGYRDRIYICTSAGGRSTPARAIDVPAATLESGPAGGVVAAQKIATEAGFDNVVTLDMGGTTADIGLIIDGAIRLSGETKVEWGTPVRLPSVDIFSVGAGGGSIAWIDNGGALRNGPQSAGALPGPASYGRGGTEPTNTDAQLVLGRFVDGEELAGDLVLNSEQAENAIRPLAERLGLSLVDVAEAILKLARERMVEALRVNVVNRGQDPRKFALFAYGGAGPMYAVDLARAVGIPTVIVPLLPGLNSSLGLLASDIRYDELSAYLQVSSNLESKALEDAFSQLESRVEEHVAREGRDPSNLEFERVTDSRYYGTTHYIKVGAGAVINDGELSRITEEFKARHEEEYGYLIPESLAEIEIANIRVVGREKRPDESPMSFNISLDTVSGETKHLPDRRMWLDGKSVDVPVINRADLTPGSRHTGPLLVVQDDSRTLIPTDTTVEVDQIGNMIITVDTKSNL